jgi:hypothetical protein
MPKLTLNVGGAHAVADQYRSEGVPQAVWREMVREPSSLQDTSERLSHGGLVQRLTGVIDEEPPRHLRPFSTHSFSLAFIL